MPSDRSVLPPSLPPRERPIIFSGSMVRAILADRKTMTRRLAWRGDVPVLHEELEPSLWQRVQPGDLLWVRHRADLFPVYWKPIPGWEGVYSAGTDGAVYRVDGHTPSKLTGTDPGNGYPRVTLCRNGTQSNYSVHTLIASAFYGPAPSLKHEVRHMDGNRSNSQPENLDWGTGGDNWGDRRAMKRGCHEEHHNAKLTSADAEAIRRSPEGAAALAEIYGVNRKTIYWIKTGRTWAEHEQPARNMPAFRMSPSPLYMPRWACRITLRVTGVKIERLQDISEEDALSEGALESGLPYVGAMTCDQARVAFSLLWDSLHGKLSWEQNREVVAISFRREEPRP